MSLTTERNDPDLNKIKENGQQESYLVLSTEEKDKGFIRPVRTTYVHKKCGQETTMHLSIAETYARNPEFYGGTFCCGCGEHLALEIDGERQFTWLPDGSGVGE